MEGIRQDTRQAVERLEGQVARLRAAVWFLFLALLAAGGAFVWQQLHPKASPSIIKVKGIVIEDGDAFAKVLITAKGIRVSDDQGQPRINLVMDDQGHPQLQVNDAQDTASLTPSGLALANAKKDGAVMTTANGATIQLRRGDKIVFKQPWDAQDLK